MKKKQIRSMLLVMIAVAMMMCAVGSTMAWLQDTTDPVVNTFTPSHIDVEISETGADEEGDKLVADFKMVPGHVLDKDPKVTVAENSEDCYVFLKVEKSNNFDNYIACKLDESWEELEAGVYYQTVTKKATATELPVLVAGSFKDPMGQGDADDVTISWGDNQVGVKPSVTEEMMDAAETSKPTITFTAYAVQLKNSNTTEFTPAQAWAQIAH